MKANEAIYERVGVGAHPYEMDHGQHPQVQEDTTKACVDVGNKIVYKEGRGEGGQF